LLADFDVLDSGGESDPPIEEIKSAGVFGSGAVSEGQPQASFRFAGGARPGCCSPPVTPYMLEFTGLKIALWRSRALLALDHGFSGVLEWFGGGRLAWA